MSDLAWPTAAELDANPALWSRWWWVNGAPERLGVDRMTYPARVTWRARFVDELPVEWFGGMVATAEEVDKQAARIAELEEHIDKGRRPHCHHVGFGEHAPFHGTHTIGHGLPGDEARLSPEETEIARLEKENTILAARIAELEAPGECASIHKLQAKLSEVTAERDRYKAGCEHYLDRAETVRGLMEVGEDVVAALRRVVAHYAQVAFSRWRWRRMATDGVPNDTERVLRREWLVSDDRAILVAAFGAEVVAKAER